MEYSGRCACGAVEIRIRGKALAVRQCWCRRCQQIAAGGPTHNAVFRAADIGIEGPTASHDYVADSGNILTRTHCPACGTPILGGSSARPDMRVVRLGVLDEAHGLMPTVAIWTSEAPPWALLDPALEQYPQQPPAPPAPQS